MKRMLILFYVKINRIFKGSQSYWYIKVVRIWKKEASVREGEQGLKGEEEHQTKLV